MNINFDFNHSGVVVTGGAQGIGLEITRQFLASGASVSIWDFSEQALNSAKAELGSYSERVHAVRVNVADAASCRAAAGALPFAVDVLVNNAGITRDKSLAKMTEDDFNAVIATNLAGVFNVTKSLLEKFTQGATQKRIINISSVVALYGNFGQTNYVASKAGVIGMTKTWARELGKKGFTVNAIAPGFIQTSMVAKMPPEVLKSMADKVPVGRLGDPADIARTALFLSSDAASYVNGAVISVDGGLVF